MATATVTPGYNWVSGEVVTPAKMNSAAAPTVAVSGIVNNDVASNAAIAGTKISPGFGSQNAVTTGTVTAAKLIPTGTSATGNGMYLPAANVLAFSTNGSERVRIGTTTVGIGTSAPVATLHVMRGTASGGTAQFNGTQQASHFAYDTDEHTYIRAGKTASNVYVGDTNTGNVILATGGGNVGINTSSPTVTLDVNGIVNTQTQYRVNGQIVVGPRRTGWTAPFGTPNRGTFDSSNVTLPQLAARVHALIDDLAAHGLIDS